MISSTKPFNKGSERRWGGGCCQSPEPGAIWEREPRQEHSKENWGRGMSICLVLMEDTGRLQSLDIQRINAKREGRKPNLAPSSCPSDIHQYLPKAEPLQKSGSKEVWEIQFTGVSPLEVRVGSEEGWVMDLRTNSPREKNQQSFYEGKEQDLMGRIKGIVLFTWMMVEGLIEAVRLKHKR